MDSEQFLIRAMIMRQAITRTRRNVDIKIGREIHKLGMMLPSMAVKKAHIMVRDIIRKKYYYSGSELEVNAQIIVGGNIYATVCGFKRNNAIQMIHL